jgi:hypothetical protein
MAIDINKKYRTRDGRDVRIYAVDAGGRAPIHGAVFDGENWSIRTWKPGGMHCERQCDLVEVKPTVKVDLWLNIYQRGALFCAFETRASADIGAGTARVACIHIEREVEHGEGI